MTQVNLWKGQSAASARPATQDHHSVGNAESRHNRNVLIGRLHPGIRGFAEDAT